MWFVTKTIDTIEAAKLDPATGDVTKYTVATNEPVNAPGALSVGPDNRINFIWSNKIGSITTTGQFTSYPAIGASEIVYGPNNTAWTHHYFNDKVYQINPTDFKLIKTVNLPANSRPWSMTFDTSGMLWVAESETNKFAKIDPSTSQVTQIEAPKTKDSNGVIAPESPMILHKVKQGKQTVSKPVPFSAKLDSKGTTVSILVDFAKYPFTSGGQLLAKSKLVSKFGFSMRQQTFTISNNARTII